MSDTPEELGLRERKKIKAKVEVQRHALRLFQHHGYPETTVEQIAAAAEVSPSTFFRYFPTKEAVVLYDSVDPIMIEAFLRQPPSLPVIAAFRATIREVLSQLPADRLTTEQVRADLVRTVPEVRAAMLDEFAGGIHLLANAIARRTRRQPDDPSVQAVSGAIFGVGITIFLSNQASVDDDYIAAFDQALAQLEAGFRL